MTKVKICGINDRSAFDTAVEAGADWVGFVFFTRSPRYVTPGIAANISGRFTGGPKRVGLFVEPTDALIAATLAAVRLDILQIYGRADDLSALRTRFDLPIWRPIGIASAADLPTGAADGDTLLLEAKPPTESTRPGGNATTFDWALLHDWEAPAPWVLAGGLTPENVASAIKQTQAPAVDVSTGVEREKGIKDPALIKAFIRAAKAGDQSDRKS